MHLSYVRMDSRSTRSWCVLCWNARGLNSDVRQRAVGNKIDECLAFVFYLQETKMLHIGHRCIRNFCPKRFNCLAYCPSTWASGGLIVLWNSFFRNGVLVDSQRFGMIISFTSKHNNEKWTLVHVYATCHGEARDLFVSWIYNLNMRVDENWLLLGDFNFIKSHTNRNLPRADVNDIHFQ